MSEQELQKLREENDRLRAENKQLKTTISMPQSKLSTSLCPFGDKAQEQQEQKELSEQIVSIVVVGASGDLAVKKTFPALFSLFVHSLLPQHLIIAGYARSNLEDSKFKEKISSKFPKKYQSKKEEFLSKVFYHSGQYKKQEDFDSLSKELSKKEQQFESKGKEKANRIFYFAIPPDVFLDAARCIHAKARPSTGGWIRLILEKPFGKDTESCLELQKQVSGLFTEDEMYRIDHYLGKEMTQNLMVLRFSNRVFEPIWNRQHIHSVQITFKENFGTEGRGGYFDKYGIIRDVMQNHLLQLLTLIAIEPPVTLSADDVHTEKVKLLRQVSPIVKDDLVIGQYLADPKGSEGGYRDEPDVPDDSTTPTFAAAVLRVHNERWEGVPFILKCGKALNEKKAEIRIQFRQPSNGLFQDLSPNELVMVVQPSEAVYLKMSTKEPGLHGGMRHVELDLTYKKRFGEEAKDIPDAYERLIYDVLRSDHNLFVRADELIPAWNIFTPILHELEQKRVRPIDYEFGSRGPKEADELIRRQGYIRTEKYSWNESTNKEAAQNAKL